MTRQHTSTPRYAIYFTPRPLSPLALFGAAAIGYDSSSKANVRHLELDGVPLADLAVATQAPRRYGFHATLVAPFYLDGQPENRLLDALDQFCGLAGPAPLGQLNVSMLDGFIALIPCAADTSRDALARRCVEFFDPLRAPLGADDLAKRNNGRLSSRQRAYLDRWGYPYVFEEFRFHMTLTDSLAVNDGERFLSALTKAYTPLAHHAFELDALSLMRQNNAASRFEVIARRVMQGDAGSP